MIISHKYKFIFIKTVKTAGTSLEVFLSQCCSEADIFTPIFPEVKPHKARNHKGLWNPLPELIDNNGHDFKNIILGLLQRDKFYNHIDAQTISHRISKKIWNSYFKFCVERNPWDKTLSHYHMANDWAGGTMDFDRYLDYGYFCINHPLYTNSHGNVIVDKIVKYESLTDDLSKVFNGLGIPFSGNLGVRAKSNYRKEIKPYQENFNDHQRAIIENAFAREIEMHGYRFNQ